MKKALISFFVLALIGINAFSYEYLIYESSVFDSLYYDDNNNVIHQKNVNSEGVTTLTTISLYNSLYQIKKNSKGYITSSNFINLLRSDRKFLDDFYKNSANMILNFFYNDQSFSNNGYKDYLKDTKILYDKNGLAVASLYNGEWAGLYNNETIKSSGYLYDNKGRPYYLNGSNVQEIGGFFDFSCITNGIRQGVGCLSWVCVAFAITIILVGAVVKYIKYQNGLYTEGIKEDKKLMASIRTEANVLAFRTLTGIDNDKTPDSVWTTYMKDDNELSPLDRERKRQYVDIMQRNYEKWKNKVL